MANFRCPFLAGPNDKFRLVDVTVKGVGGDEIHQGFWMLQASIFEVVPAGVGMQTGVQYDGLVDCLPKRGIIWIGALLGL